MFTGIIQYLGSAAEVAKSGDRMALSVDAGPLADDAKPGDSVCVNGVCLTVTVKTGATLRFDVIGETLSRTTLGELRRGDPLNLEPALRPADRLGGHFVTGHVDGVATVGDVLVTPGEVRLAFECDAGLARGMISKGSVAVDGVSLTLTEVSDGRFAVALIPHTLSATTLGRKHSGDRVNVETDLLGKWVLKALGKPSGLSEDFLREHGFA